MNLRIKFDLILLFRSQKFCFVRIGKTSLTIGMFRLIEPDCGQILVDDIDITSIGLHDLREALTIIPQDPVLFCGSLRSNLDPFEQFDDANLWSALEKAHLIDTVRGWTDEDQNDGLSYEITEGGSNLRLFIVFILFLSKSQQLFYTKHKQIII